MATHFTPVLDEYFRLVNQATIQIHGTDYEVNIGDIETSGITPNLTDIERKSREYAEKSTARIDTIEKDATFAMTAMSLTKEMKQILWMDTDDDKLIQAAATGIEKTFANLRKGKIFNLGRQLVTINSADDGGNVPVVFEEGVHYRVSSKTGRIEILAVPQGATQIVVDFDCDAVEAEDDIGVYGGMAGNGVYAKITFYGVSNIGQNFMIEIWNVRLKPTSEIATQGGDDYSQVQIEGRIFADATKADKFRFYKITEI